MLIYNEMHFFFKIIIVSTVSAQILGAKVKITLLRAEAGPL